MELNRINPTFVQHEGFTYLTFNGEFFKGCKRCGGEGHYSHNGEHSRCYDCDNTSAKLGEQLENLAAAEKWCRGKAVRKAQRDRAREAKRLAHVAEMVANQDALKAADEDVFNFLMGVVIEEDTQDMFPTYDEWAANQQAVLDNYEKDSFIRTMAETLRWVAPSKPFTPKMIAAVRSTMERRTQQATEAAAHPAPTGRVVVTGTIASAKLVDSDYGTAYKILVKEDAGFKVWCTLPSAQAEQAREEFGNDQEVGYSVWFTGSSNEPEKFTGVKGRRITFTATLEPSRDDVSFAFGKRPTKGAWL